MHKRTRVVGQFTVEPSRWRTWVTCGFCAERVSFGANQGGCEPAVKVRVWIREHGNVCRVQSMTGEPPDA